MSASERGGWVCPLCHEWETPCCRSATAKDTEIAALTAERDGLAALVAEVARYIELCRESGAGLFSADTHFCAIAALLTNTAAILAARDERMKRQGRQECVDVLNDELICWFLPPVGKDEDFRKALARLVGWEVKVALHPAVSAQAQGLKRQGAIEELEAVGCTCAMRIDSPMITSHTSNCVLSRIAALKGGE